jgi:hypothetical protein
VQISEAGGSMDIGSGREVQIWEAMSLVVISP